MSRRGNSTIDRIGNIRMVAASCCVVKRVRHLFLGAFLPFVLLGLLLASGCTLPQQGLNFVISFSDANGLVVGSRILYRGVPVGEVREVDLSETGLEARVSVTVEPEHQSFLREGSIFRISVSSTNALIPANILVDPPGDDQDQIADGSTVVGAANYAEYVQQLAARDGGNVMVDQVMAGQLDVNFAVRDDGTLLSVVSLASSGVVSHVSHAILADVLLPEGPGWMRTEDSGPQWTVTNVSSTSANTNADDWPGAYTEIMVSDGLWYTDYGFQYRFEVSEISLRDTQVVESPGSPTIWSLGKDMARCLLTLGDCDTKELADDLLDLVSGTGISAAEQLAVAVVDDFPINVSVSMPGDITNANIDGPLSDSLHWSSLLSQMGEEGVYAQSRLWHLPRIIGGAGLTAALIVGGWFLVKRRKAVVSDDDLFD